MGTSSGTFPPGGIYPQLANPIFVVLSGTEISRKHQLMKHFFDEMHSEYMAAQLYRDTAQPAQCSELIPIPVTSASTLQPAFFSELDAAIRRSKRHRYPNNNDLTVCLFFDSTTSDMLVTEVCRELYALLSHAYYNHVFFDIYFLLLEDFVPSDGRIAQNATAARQLSELHDQEWVRYIFLLSDVTSKGQLILDSDKLFQTVLTAILLTNSYTREKTMGQLQDILIREAEGSKFFCLGQTTLCPSVREIQQMVQTELLLQLSTQVQINENFPKKQSCLGSLFDDIRSSVLKESGEIEHIGCYTYTVSAAASALTNSDCLDTFFHENPELYMEEVGKRCRQHFEEQTVHYWRQIKVWLDDMLCQYNASICIPQCEQFVVAVADDCLNQLQQQLQARSNTARDQFVAWKNEAALIKQRSWRCASERAAYCLLDQWRVQKVDELTYQIMDRCISDIRTYIKCWQEDVIRKCSLFSELKRSTDHKWTTLLRDSTASVRLLLQYRRNALSAYLQQYPWRVGACRSQLDALLRKEAGAAEIANLVSIHTEQLLREGARSTLPWVDSQLFNEPDNAQTVAAYEKLYHSLKTDIPLNTRRDIPNAATYLCFLGRTQDSFVNYVQQQDDFPCVLHFEEYFIPPEVFCFQHLSSSSTFFWKEHINQGG